MPKPAVTWLVNEDALQCVASRASPLFTSDPHECVDPPLARSHRGKSGLKLLAAAAAGGQLVSRAHIWASGTTAAGAAYAPSRPMPT